MPRLLSLLILLLASCSSGGRPATSPPSSSHLGGAPSASAKQILEATESWAATLDGRGNGYPAILALVDENPSPEQLEQTFHQALSEPAFHPPKLWEEGLEAQRRPLGLLQVYKDWAQDDYDRWLDGLELGARLSGHCDLVGQMLATHIMDEAVHRLGEQLPESKPELEKLLSRLLQLRATENDFLRVLDLEFCFGWRALEGSPESIREREHLAEMYLQVRPTIEAMAPLPDRPASSRDEPEADLATLLLPNFHRAYQDWRGCRSHTHRLQLRAALELFRLERGRYPEDLKALTPDYVRALPRNFLSEDGMFLYRLDGGTVQLD